MLFLILKHAYFTPLALVIIFFNLYNRQNTCRRIYFLKKNSKPLVKIKPFKKIINKFKSKPLVKTKFVTAFKNSVIINITRFFPLFILRYKGRNISPMLFFK